MAKSRISLLFLSVLLSSINGYNQNPVLVDSLLDRAEKNRGNYEEFVLDMSDLAFEYYYNKPDSAIYFLLQALPLCQVKKDTADLGYFHGFLGVCYKNLGSYDSAVYHMELALLYREMIKDQIGMAASHNNLGKFYHAKGNYDKSVFHFYQSINLFEELKDDAHLAQAHSNLGELYIDLGEYERAQTHFNLSKTYYSTTGDDNGKAWTYYDIGLIKSKINQIDSAIYYHQKANEIWIKTDRTKESSDALVRIAQLQFEQGNDQSALKNLKMAEMNFAQLNYPYGLSQVFLERGRYFKRIEDYTSAISYYEKAKKESDFLQANGLLLSVYYEMYESSKLVGKQKAALSYLENYLQLKDSLFGMEQEKIRLDYQTRFDVLNKEKQIRQLQDSTRIQQLMNDQKQLELQKNKLAYKQQRLGIYVLILGIGLVITLSVLLYRRNVTKSKVNTDLQKALSEREALLKEIHHRVKNNLQIVSSLLNLQAGNTSKKSAQEILKESQDRIMSMTIIHENLYKSDNLDNINFTDYVERLLENLMLSFGNHQQDIIISNQVEPIKLNMDFLVPCGLIINELVTNSMKYAFSKSENGNIIIKATYQNGHCLLEYTDDGCGLPADLDTSRLTSLGLRLVEGLVRQMKGELNFHETVKGVHIEIKFKINER